MSLAIIVFYLHVWAIKGVQCLGSWEARVGVRRQIKEIKSAAEMSEAKIPEAKAFSDNKKGISIDNWKTGITEKLRIVKEEGSEDMIMSIFKVPNKLRKVKDDAYSPRVVSIGPFHQDNHDLAAMREHKWSYMLHFFQHIEDPQRYKKCWEECTNAIYGFAGKVRANYAEKIKYNVDELAEIMLLDGSFILDLFLGYEQHLDTKLEHQSNALFNNSWMLPALRHDLALLENQIPFFVLKKLYETIMPSKPPNSVNSLALKFFEMKQKPTKEEPEILVSECKHVIDLLHKFYVSTLDSKLTNYISIPVPNELILENYPSSTVNGTSSPHTKHDPSRKNLWGFSYGASQLLEAGIKFEKGLGDDHLLEITFENGVIRIPPYRNNFFSFPKLDCFRAMQPQQRHHMTSYVILMKSLIRSQRDIKLLQKKYEIINRAYWISNQDFLNQFRSIIENVVVKDFSYAMLRGEVDRYRNTRHWQKHKASWGVWLHKYIKDVHHKYFRTPWSIISFIAAVVLFFLTSLQTYFTIYPR